MSASYPDGPFVPLLGGGYVSRHGHGHFSRGGVSVYPCGSDPHGLRGTEITIEPARAYLGLWSRGGFRASVDMMPNGGTVDVPSALASIAEARARGLLSRAEYCAARCECRRLRGGAS